MGYIIEKEQKTHKVSQEEKTSIAKKISEDFRTYDDARATQLDKAHKLIDEIYFKNVAEAKETEKSKKWKSTLKMCKLFMYFQILNAFIWKNTYANTNSMFDVSGDSLEADNNSNKQKTALVDIFEKMNYSHTMDKIIINAIIYGELISFVTWKKHSKEYRRPISFFEMVKKPKNMLKMLEAKAKGEEYYIDEDIDYDNPYVYDVDPENFVFDTTQERNWESCPKINRTWRTPEDIINNKYFEVSKEVAQEIRNLVKQGSNESDLGNQEPSANKNEVVNGTTVEMLEHWGDLTLSDGTVLKNWYAVVIAGKYLVRFEKNPFILNPFTYGAIILDKNTKRGISPLYSVYDIARTQEDILRRTMNLQSLQENPPVLAPEGFFDQDIEENELYPGKIVEYNASMYANVPVEPMTFNTTAFADDLEYIDDLMSEISGVFPNMAGASENDRTTATEISTKVEGQLTRLKMVLDIINQYLILEDVKKVAELKANFTFGDETVFINNENKPENVIINDQVRQGQYRYTYADRSATSERFNYVDMVAQAMQMFIKAGLQANVQEIFIWYMEQKGVENPERFLQADGTLSPEVQQTLLNNPQMAPILQQMEQAVQMSKQGQNSQGEGNEKSAQIENQQAPELVNPSAGLQGRNLLNG